MDRDDPRIERCEFPPYDEEKLEAMERAYERFLAGRTRPRDYRNSVPVGSRLSLVEYRDEPDGRDWS